MMDSFNYMLVLEQSVKSKGLEAMGILITIKSLGSCGIMESCIPVGSWWPEAPEKGLLLMVFWDNA